MLSSLVFIKFHLRRPFTPSFEGEHPPRASRSPQLLSYRQFAPISLLKSTFPQVLILINLKAFRINTYKKNRGRGLLPFSSSRPMFTPKETRHPAQHPVFRIFFQVPYALSPLFATLTKNCRGVYPFFPKRNVPAPVGMAHSGSRRNGTGALAVCRGGGSRKEKMENRSERSRAGDHGLPRE